MSTPEEGLAAMAAGETMVVDNKGKLLFWAPPPSVTPEEAMRLIERGEADPELPEETKRLIAEANEPTAEEREHTEVTLDMLDRQKKIHWGRELASRGEQVLEELKAIRRTSKLVEPYTGEIDARIKVRTVDWLTALLRFVIEQEQAESSQGVKK